MSMAEAVENGHTDQNNYLDLSVSMVPELQPSESPLETPTVLDITPQIHQAISTVDHELLRTANQVNAEFPGLLTSIKRVAQSEDVDPHQRTLFESIISLEIGKIVVHQIGPHPKTHILDLQNGSKNVAVRARAQLSRGSGCHTYTIVGGNFF